MSDHGGVAPGWYPDPSDGGTQRYWDGNAWTEHTAPISGRQTMGAGDSGGGAPAFPANAGGQPLPKVETWLWQSIVVTLVCGCVPLGIVGIVFASQAQSALNIGNVEEARSKASTARLMSIIGASVSLALVVFWILFVFLGVLSAGAGF